MEEGEGGSILKADKIRGFSLTLSDKKGAIEETLRNPELSGRASKRKERRRDLRE